jgi:hypothetical protein
MKKLLGILVLLLLWCNVGFAEILDLGKGVKIKILNNHEYFEVPFSDYTKMNMKDTGVSALEIDQIIKDQELLGYVSTTKSKIIANKGIKILGDAELMRLKGEDISNTKLMRIINKCTESSKSNKTFIKCYYKEINGDPLFQITVADKKVDKFKFINERLSQSPSEKEKNELKKEFLYKNQKIFDSSILKSKASTKFIIFDDNKWLIYLFGTQNIFDGFKIKNYAFLITINDYLVMINSWCLSAKTCKIIKEQMADMIEPSFLITKNNLKKIK